METVPDTIDRKATQMILCHDCWGAANHYFNRRWYPCMQCSGQGVVELHGIGSDGVAAWSSVELGPSEIRMHSIPWSGPNADLSSRTAPTPKREIILA